VEQENAKPILFIGHLDVVEALRSDWTTDPFEFIEKDGYFYGRGTEDMKEGDAILVTNFIRLKKEGYLPDRDLILALTADEKGGSSNGVGLACSGNIATGSMRSYCINLDGGEFEKDKDKRLLAGIEASEKVYVDFHFESLNPGGHSSVPSPDNAIYHLAGALSRLQSFPSLQKSMKYAELFRTETRRRGRTTGQVAADMKAVAKQRAGSGRGATALGVSLYNSLLHTTCVATMLSGGHAPNALRKRARQRQLPDFSGEDPEEVHKTLEARGERSRSQDHRRSATHS